MTAGSDALAADLRVSELQGSARALAEEAVRIKARLDTLDRWVNGDHEGWFQLSDRFGSEITLLINAPLVEARQQALALRSILAELSKIQGAAEAPPAPAPSKSDELKARREQRHKSAG